MVKLSANQAAGSVIVLKSADGTDLLTFSPKTSYDCVIVSCSELAQGNTYTLTAGEESQTIEMTELIYGSGGMGGGMPGGKGGMNGGMGGGRGGMRQDARKGGQMPEGMPEGELPSGEVPQMPEDWNGELPGKMPQGGTADGENTQSSTAQSM